MFSNPQLFAALLISGLLQLGVVKVPFVLPIFQIALELSPSDWGLILGLALVPLSMVEIVKLALHRRAP